MSVVHSLRTRGLRRTLLFALSGSTIPILAELLAVNVLKVLRHHARPQVGGVPLAIVLLWYNVGYGTVAMVRGASHPHKEGLVFVPTVALVATSFDLLLDPFGLDLGLWEWSGDGPYAPEIKGPNGKRGVPSLNFAGWIALTTSFALADQRIESAHNDACASDPVVGPGPRRAAALLLLLTYYLPAAAWALKQGRRKYLLYSAPFATTLWAALRGRSASS